MNLIIINKKQGLIFINFKKNIMNINYEIYGDITGEVEHKFNKRFNSKFMKSLITDKILQKKYLVNNKLRISFEHIFICIICFVYIMVAVYTKLDEVILLLQTLSSGVLSVLCFFFYFFSVRKAHQNKLFLTKVFISITMYLMFLFHIVVCFKDLSHINETSSFVSDMLKSPTQEGLQLYSREKYFFLIILFIKFVYFSFFIFAEKYFIIFSATLELVFLFVLNYKFSNFFFEEIIIDIAANAISFYISYNDLEIYRGYVFYRRALKKKLVESAEKLRKLGVKNLLFKGDKILDLNKNLISDSKAASPLPFKSEPVITDTIAINHVNINVINSVNNVNCNNNSNNINNNCSNSICKNYTNNINKIFTPSTDKIVATKVSHKALEGYINGVDSYYNNGPELFEKREFLRNLVEINKFFTYEDIKLEMAYENAIIEEYNYFNSKRAGNNDVAKFQSVKTNLVPEIYKKTNLKISLLDILLALKLELDSEFQQIQKMKKKTNLKSNTCISKQKSTNINTYPDTDNHKNNNNNKFNYFNSASFNYDNNIALQGSSNLNALDFENKKNYENALNNLNDSAALRNARIFSFGYMNNILNNSQNQSNTNKINDPEGPEYLLNNNNNNNSNNNKKVLNINNNSNFHSNNFNNIPLKNKLFNSNNNGNVANDTVDSISKKTDIINNNLNNSLINMNNSSQNFLLGNSILGSNSHDYSHNSNYNNKTFKANKNNKSFFYSQAEDRDDLEKDETKDINKKHIINSLFKNEAEQIININTSNQNFIQLINGNFNLEENGNNLQIKSYEDTSRHQIINESLIQEQQELQFIAEKIKLLKYRTLITHEFIYIGKFYSKQKFYENLRDFPISTPDKTLAAKAAPFTFLENECHSYNYSFPNRNHNSKRFFHVFIKRLFINNNNYLELLIAEENDSINNLFLTNNNNLNITQNSLRNRTNSEYTNNKNHYINHINNSCDRNSQSKNTQTNKSNISDYNTNENEEINNNNSNRNSNNNNIDIIEECKDNPLENLNDLNIEYQTNSVGKTPVDFNYIKNNKTISFHNSNINNIDLNSIKNSNISKSNNVCLIRSNKTDMPNSSDSYSIKYKLNISGRSKKTNNETNYINSNNNNINEVMISENNSFNKKEFGKVAHELKTPLNAIIGLINELIIKNKQKDIDRNLTSINSLANYLVFLISDLTQYCNNLSYEEIQVYFDKIDLFEILNFCFEILNALLACKSFDRNTIVAQFDFEQQINNFYVSSDEIRLKQIILNLISNAVKFTKNGTIKISAKLKKDKKSVKVSITDTGIGIKEADMQKLFNENERINDGSILNSFGSGFGLAISKMLSEKLNLDFRMNSSYGCGSTFSIYIPVESEKEKPFEKSENFESGRDLSNSSRKIPEINIIKTHMPISKSNKREVSTKIFNKAWEINLNQFSSHSSGDWNSINAITERATKRKSTLGTNLRYIYKETARTGSKSVSKTHLEKKTTLGDRGICK